MTAPAFYALRSGGWRDYVTLLHLPYTAWHLSYVVVGACLAASVDWPVLGLTVLAFTLAMGVGAHALDELNGRTLRTSIPDGVLVGLDRTLWIVALVVLGAALVPVYNLELLGGRAHTDVGFALAWGAFPVVTAYVAQTGTLRGEALLAALWATLLSLAQRRLSTPARRLRRSREPGPGDLAPLEDALRLLTGATVVLALALVVLRA